MPRCKIIAEVAQTHDGSLGLAHAFIDAVAKTGADAVKFQTHIAHAESTPAEPFRVPFSRQDGSRYEYWKRTEFTEDEWRGLREHAREYGLQFLSSPFSIEAVELLERIGVPAWKVGSGEILTLPMLERIAQTKKPIFISTGMSSFAEIDTVVKLLRKWNSDFTLMQCTTTHPCPPEKVGLNVMIELRDRYRCPVGLSDHSGTIYPALAARVYGASVIEVHVTLSREMFGPDVVASVTAGELRQLVEGVRFIERMLDNPVDKDAIAQEMGPVRALFFKSVVARMDLPAGTVISKTHLALKKPGTGILANRLKNLIGRRLRRAVVADEILHEEDFENGVEPD